MVGRKAADVLQTGLRPFLQLLEMLRELAKASANGI
jgi:hypothetical protein